MIQKDDLDALVERLRWLQTSGLVHPYTCGNHRSVGHQYRGADYGCLYPTRAGMLCLDCGYLQELPRFSEQQKRELIASYRAMFGGITGFKRRTPWFRTEKKMSPLQIQLF